MLCSSCQVIAARQRKREAVCKNVYTITDETALTWAVNLAENRTFTHLEKYSIRNICTFVKIYEKKSPILFTVKKQIQWNTGRVLPARSGKFKIKNNKAPTSIRAKLSNSNPRREKNGCQNKYSPDNNWTGIWHDTPSRCPAKSRFQRMWTRKSELPAFILSPDKKKTEKRKPSTAGSLPAPPTHSSFKRSSSHQHTSSPKGTDINRHRARSPENLRRKYTWDKPGKIEISVNKQALILLCNRKPVPSWVPKVMVTIEQT